MGVLSQKGCESSVIRSSLETHTHTHVTRSTAYIVCGLAAFEKAPLSHVNIIEQQSELQCAPVFQRPDTHTHTLCGSEITTFLFHKMPSFIHGR